MADAIAAVSHVGALFARGGGDKCVARAEAASAKKNYGLLKYAAFFTALSDHSLAALSG